VTTNPASHLELHVIGGNKGEAVIIRLPDGGWGVVDCFAASLDDERANPVLQFLRKQIVGELEFLCLTHPHDDHFRGMSRLLQEFRVRCFWQSAVMFPHRLKSIIASALDAEASGADEARSSQRELESIFELVAKRRERTKSARREPLIPKHCSANTQVYPTQAVANASVSVHIIAPTARDIEEYHDELDRLFDATGRMKATLPYSRHNAISIGLLIKFGQTRIVLGGDVERAAWQNALQECDQTHLSAHCVKVSHHGSTTGYCDGLWEVLSAQRKPIAIVTSFRQHRLPRKSALEHIGRFASRVLSTKLDSIVPEELPVPLAPTAPVRSRRAIASQFHAWTDQRDEAYGICSLVFDDKGNCVSESFSNGAGLI
jgi:beta-lactamase superfamily II metal-dependent hydrolase